MVDLWWNGAVVLTLAGALVFWGARVFEVESFFIDSSGLLGLPGLGGHSLLLKDAWKGQPPFFGIQ